MSQRYTIAVFIALFLMVQYFAINQIYCTNSNKIVTTAHIDSTVNEVHHHCSKDSCKTFCNNPSHDCRGQHIPVTSFLKASNNNISLELVDNQLTTWINLIPPREDKFYIYYIKADKFTEESFPDQIILQISSTTILC